MWPGAARNPLPLPQPCLLAQKNQEVAQHLQRGLGLRLGEVQSEELVQRGVQLSDFYLAS